MYDRATSSLVSYVRNIIPDDMSIPFPGHLALSGWIDAHSHAGAKFAVTEFSEVRQEFIANSSPHLMLL